METTLAIHQADSLKPDIVLMDIMLPQTSGIEATAKIKRNHPAIKVLVLTTYGDEKTINAAMEAGADGYLLKDAEGDALLEAIRTTCREEAMVSLDKRVAHHLFKALPPPGQSPHQNPLTPREQEVLKLITRGLSNSAIASTLNICEGTVKVHVNKILAKLKASSRTEAAVMAVQKGLVLLD